MEPDLRQLRHVAAVAHWRSFTKAAESLGISQPALSRSVAAFEQACKARIFDRVPSGVEPTKFGAAIIADIEAILAQAGRLVRDLAARVAAISGSINLGFGPLVAGLLLPRLLTRVADERPKLEINTMIDNASRLLDALGRGQIELALLARTVVPEAANLTVESIGSYRLSYIARVDHPLVRAGTVTPEEIEAYPIASGTPPDGSRRSWAVYGFPAPTITCENFAILEQAALLSNIILLTSPDHLQEDRRDRMKVLEVEGWTHPREELCVVQIADRTQSPIAKLVLTMLRDQLGNPELPDRAR